MNSSSLLPRPCPQEREGILASLHRLINNVISLAKASLTERQTSLSPWRIARWQPRNVEHSWLHEQHPHVHYSDHQKARQNEELIEQPSSLSFTCTETTFLTKILRRIMTLYRGPEKRRSHANEMLSGRLTSDWTRRRGSPTSAVRI